MKTGYPMTDRAQIGAPKQLFLVQVLLGFGFTEQILQNYHPRVCHFSTEHLAREFAFIVLSS
jgi:hypothetical protein